jgi:tetratricopeptide (TPR) repeat protein
VGPLLAELRGAGLLVLGEGAYGFHELVRERAAAWMATHPEEQGGRTPEQVWRAYGKRYAAAFSALAKTGKPGAQDRAAEAGRRALSYLVRAGDFDALGGFASQLVTSTKNPALLRAVIAQLQEVADQVLAGKARSSVRTYLADALRNAGQPEQSLPLYEQSATEAEQGGHWEKLGTICQNWGNALGDVGQLDQARRAHQRSADAMRRAGSPRVFVVGSELEALRIDVHQGEAEKALPEIERRLEEVRGWWRRHGQGEQLPDAPVPHILGRVLLGALDIARMANQALERWQPCLDLLHEMEQVQRGHGEGEHGLARVRFNRYGPLLRLGQLREAQEVLEGCLEVDREAEDLPGQAADLSALADVWDERGATGQAIALERQALAVRERLADPNGRAISHGNLSNYLSKAAQAEEEARHLLAALVYFLVTGHHQGLTEVLNNIRIRMRKAAAAGDRYELLPLTALLERPEFDALRRFLVEAGVSPADLQAKIDQRLEQVRSQA